MKTFQVIIENISNNMTSHVHIDEGLHVVHYARCVVLQINYKYEQNQDLAEQCLLWMRHIVNAGSAEPHTDFDTRGDASNFSAVLHDGYLLARCAHSSSSSIP